MPRYFLGLALVLGVISAPPRYGDGCAVVPRPGNSVQIAEETAILVWDAASKTQHFIRRAAFETDAPDFGFLVPTPTQPTLAAVSDAAFTHLEAVIRPKVEEQRHVEFVPLCGCGAATRMAEKKSAAVRVLDEQRVGEYDTAVLEADEAGALADWLAKHGYPANPELTSWLAPYVAAQWKVTAFKIAQDGKARSRVQTSAVRMSFRAEQPFFPYREPRVPDGPAGFHGSRRLRVFFLADARMAGSFANAPWSAAVPWADRLSDDQRAMLIDELGVPADHLRPGPWLTVFEDPASQRPGAGDVFFAPAADPSAVRPPPIIHRLPIPIPAECALLALFVGGGAGLLGLRRLSRSAATSPPS